ncbi:MAG: hypothetical protein FJ191_03740 [Gammaproteobacteria bacterium]|nr:hypothetical protein [Gammaproteobacteria bacterium]
MPVLRTLTALLLACALAAPAAAQLETVPMKGLGNAWVKGLQLRGNMDWEWLETYPDQVFFATRKEAARNGDVVTMWMRIEYKEARRPGPHRSVLSKDDWDCAQRRRSTAGVFFFQWNNLQDDDPEHSTNLLRNWEPIEPGTIGETLFQFACSIRPVQAVVQ